MKISGASIMGRALIVCSVCLFFATAVKADVCFLPQDLCYEGAANVVSQDCSGFTETSPKGEGWNCVSCGDRYKCTEKECPAGYTTSSTCGIGLSATCDGGKSGNKNCCKCEDSAQKCINEGYGFVKTENNSCSSQDKCPYNSSYYKICTCTGYDEVSNGDQCNNYATCDLGDADHENYYKITGSRRQCNNSAYVTADSPQYTSGENDCTLACTESCDNNKKYYTCTAKITCNPSEGKYSTKELCEASLQQFSWVDWLYQTVQNINLIRTSYAATTNDLDLEMCHYCRSDPNPRECYKACMPQTAIDNPMAPLCPVDQDRRCVSCTNGCVRGSGYASYPCCSKVTDEPITACIGMGMEMDMNCVHCKTDNPSWRAPGCEGYPCCIETPCIDDCTVLEAPFCTRSGGTWVKTGLKSKCGNDCLECQQPQATESPCELKDGCWVVKNGGCDEASGLYASEGACTIMGWPCSKTGNCWRRTKAELTYVRKSTCNPVLIVRGTETTVTITPNTGNHVFVDAGINTLSYGLSTGIPSSFTIMGSDGSTVMTAKQTGTGGAIGSYTFVAGKSYQITPNCALNPVTCTIDPDDPDVFGGYWQLDNISCDDGTNRKTPGAVTLTYSSGSGCHTTVDVTVGKGSNMSSPVLSTNYGSCSGIGCTINHGGNSWCSSVESTCATFDSNFSQDSQGYYVTEDGRKIYWQVDGSENFTGSCGADRPTYTLYVEEQYPINNPCISNIHFKVNGEVRSNYTTAKLNDAIEMKYVNNCFPNKNFKGWSMNDMSPDIAYDPNVPPSHYLETNDAFILTSEYLRKIGLSGNSDDTLNMYAYVLREPDPNWEPCCSFKIAKNCHIGWSHYDGCAEDTNTIAGNLASELSDYSYAPGTTPIGTRGCSENICHSVWKVEDETEICGKSDLERKFDRLSTSADYTNATSCEGRTWTSSCHHPEIEYSMQSYIFERQCWWRNKNNGVRTHEKLFPGFIEVSNGPLYFQQWYDSVGTD